MKTPISQSTITALIDYEADQACGLQIKAKLDGVEFPSSDVQRLGQYFEYRATGQRTYHGHIPEPEYLKEKKDKKGNPKPRQLTIDYRRAGEAAELFKKYISALGWEIVESGKRWERDGMTAFTDCKIIVTPSGTWPEDWGKRPEYPKFIMDLKYTGGLNQSFGDYGWGGLHKFPKPKITIQAVHYNLVTDLPFMWAVFDSKEAGKVRFIPAEITEQAAETHMRLVEQTRNMIDINNMTGWRAIPEYNRCKACPLFENCKDRHDYPMPEKSVLIG